MGILKRRILNTFTYFSAACLLGIGWMLACPTGHAEERPPTTAASDSSTARTGHISIVRTAPLDAARARQLLTGPYLIIGREGNRFTLYCTLAEVDALNNAGISLQVTEEQYVPEAGEVLRSSFPDGYPGFSELTGQLADFAVRYPGICQLSSIGKSTNLQDIWALKLSDNAALDEQEPEVRLLSTIHGDEKAVLPVCLQLVEFLLSNYGQSTPNGQRVTALLDSTEIWIVPVLNPDGYANHTRVNANGEDLNRSFPDGVLTDLGSPYPVRVFDTTGLQPEVKAVIDFSLDHNFVLSAGLHAGDLLIAYPYGNNDWGTNGTPSAENTPTPDDDTYRQIAGDWRDKHPHMTTVINAAQWYTVSGEMPDWAYRFLGILSITPELSDIKTPPPDTHEGLWLDNREALLSFLEIPAPLLRGIVRDADTQAPLYAQIQVEGIDRSVYSHPETGEYYRLLQPGTYAFQITAEGYEPVTICPLMISTDDVVLNIALSPATPEEVAITLRAGWNAFSLPLNPLDGRVSELFAAAPSPVIWTWENGVFTPAVCLTAGPGYWMFMPTARTLTYTGLPPVRTAFQFPAGWVFTGFFSAIAESELPPQVSTLFGWNAGGQSLQPVGTTAAKQAFWLHFSDPVKLDLATGE